jgi:hypothetical protein
VRVVVNFSEKRPNMREKTEMYSPNIANCSAATDPDLGEWLRYQSEHGSIFLKSIADAAFCACAPDYVTLRPVLIELRKRYPAS